MSKLDKNQINAAIATVLTELAPIARGKDPKRIAIEFLERNIVEQTGKLLSKYLGCHAVDDQVSILECLYDRIAQKESEPRTPVGGIKEPIPEVQPSPPLVRRAEQSPTKKGKRTVL